jgi:KipI family sensor histidine kinase inhibitor
MQVLRCGLESVLVEVSDRDEVLGLRTALRRARLDGVTEVIPAARTLLVRYDPRRLDAVRIAALIAELPPTAVEEESAGEVVIPVHYDGADLADVGTRTGLPRGELIARHLAPEYTVAFCGFAPGFAYLTGLDPVLRLPRRATPRTHVPAGSVAIADEYTGVYPRSSPGGWQLLGHTDLAVWDLNREPVTLLPPGTRVRFEAA